MTNEHTEKEHGEKNEIFSSCRVDDNCSSPFAFSHSVQHSAPHWKISSGLFFFRLEFEFSFRLINFGCARTAVAFLFFGSCLRYWSKQVRETATLRRLAWKQRRKSEKKAMEKKCIIDRLHNSKLSSNYFVLVWCTEHTTHVDANERTKVSIFTWFMIIFLVFEEVFDEWKRKTISQWKIIRWRLLPCRGIHHTQTTNSRVNNASTRFIHDEKRNEPKKKKRKNNPPITHSIKPEKKKPTENKIWSIDDDEWTAAA